MDRRLSYGYGIVVVFLLVIIASSLIWYAPSETYGVFGPVFEESLLDGYVSETYYSHIVVEGEVSWSRIKTLKRDLSKLPEDIFIVTEVNCPVITLENGRVHYLLNDWQHPGLAEVLQNLDLNNVYLIGNYFNYRDPAGELHQAIIPVEASNTQLVDPVVVSKEIISKLYGRLYYQLYFTDVRIWKDMYSTDETYQVRYNYRIPSGNKVKKAEVDLFFNNEVKLSRQEGLPDSTSLNPFKVSSDEAISLALEYGLDASYNSSIEVRVMTSWRGLDDSIQAETYIDPDTTMQPIILSHYVWMIRVKIHEDINSVRYQHFVIDCNTGKLLTKGEMTFISVGSIDITP
jgi:hypothetical protein